MKKEQRQVESLVELLKEQAEIERQIAVLPVGYISVKVISGHTYNYRQWREGSKIISQYVPETMLNSVKRKIAARKEQEVTLKAVKKDIKSVTKKVLKAGLLTEEEIAELKEKVAAEAE
ncbi:MAG: hypothetical protein HUJ59_03525 [Bacilli bacterium]|nr:hypothetical protein [Bacilli bacterium]